jgi:hypothetical protein
MNKGRFGQLGADGRSFLFDGGRQELSKVSRNVHVWFVPYGCIASTQLEKFIVLETGKKNAKK